MDSDNSRTRKNTTSADDLFADLDAILGNRTIETGDEYLTSSNVEKKSNKTLSPIEIRQLKTNLTEEQRNHLLAAYLRQKSEREGGDFTQFIPESSASRQAMGSTSGRRRLRRKKKSAEGEEEPVPVFTNPVEKFGRFATRPIHIEYSRTPGVASQEFTPTLSAQQAKVLAEEAVRTMQGNPDRDEAGKKFVDSYKNKLTFLSNPWDSLDEKISKAFHVRNKSPLFNLPFEYKRVLSEKNPAERKADSILEAANSGLLTAEEVDKMYKDLTIENARLKRQFRQQLSPTHFTDEANLQTVPLSFTDKRTHELLHEQNLRKNQTVTRLMKEFRDKENRHNLLSRIHWPLSSELDRLEKQETEGFLSVHDEYTRKFANLSKKVKWELKQIDMDPVLTDSQKHLKARDLITEYQFDIFNDPHREYRNEYMNYIETRQKLLRDRLGLPLRGRSGMNYTYNVNKSDELFDFAKSRGAAAAIPSPRFIMKNSVLAIAEVLRVWEMDNLDNNVINKRLYGHLSRQSRTNMHRRRMNRRWLKKMIPKTFRVSQIYKNYFSKTIRMMK